LRRALAVLRILRAEQLERTPFVLHNTSVATKPEPLEARPVLVVAVDEHLDARIALDVP
jgi:hypothetical protein